MKKLIALFLVALLVLLGYVAAGPYLAMRGIHAAVEARDFGKLERYVDFPALRVRMREQVARRLASAATDATGGIMGGDTGRALVDQVSGHAVDAMVSPLGISVLLQGRALAHRVTGEDGKAAGNAADPLLQAKTKFESPSRFTATAAGAEGKPVVFVFERRGLRWKLADIRLSE